MLVLTGKIHSTKKFYKPSTEQGRICMPFVNIKITNENVTKEKKEKLIEGATQLLVDVLGKNPATTIVVIEEVETDNWGIGGESVTEIRQRLK